MIAISWIHWDSRMNIDDAVYPVPAKSDPMKLRKPARQFIEVSFTPLGSHLWTPSDVGYSCERNLAPAEFLEYPLLENRTHILDSAEYNLCNSFPTGFVGGVVFAAVTVTLNRCCISSCSNIDCIESDFESRRFSDCHGYQLLGFFFSREMRDEQ